MSELDLDKIRSNYELMSDTEIIRIATQDAVGLRPEVADILRSEINKRKLSTKLLEGVVAQNTTYELDELTQYAETLRNLPCPNCGLKNDKLNGTVIHTVKSFVIFTTSERRPKVACPTCLDKMNENAISSTALLGWWGIPWGLIKTPIYIYRNLKSKKENKEQQANKTLLAFTAHRIGEIIAANGENEKLLEILKSEKY
ncbi:hypothetical protein [Flavihumibacter solisilvae]|uniref:hypothetical protein n=1 Tax=Flavihumibacter solisilvae TaxID=1349421 RepID=UPI00068CF7F8|nr:hypothetical protein [Flavihumibacter solisilvae]